MERKTLVTPRLKLVSFKKEDAPDLYAYAKHPDVGPHAGWKPHDSVEESEMIIEKLFIPNGTWGIRVLQEEGSYSPIIGTIAMENDRFRPDASTKEIGYSLAHYMWGKGYMTEAAKAVIQYGFEELNLEIMTICTSPVNKRSQRIAEKCGFTYEGKIRKAYRVYTGELRDSLVFSLTKEEWEKGIK